MYGYIYANAHIASCACKCTWDCYETWEYMMGHFCGLILRHAAWMLCLKHDKVIWIVLMMIHYTQFADTQLQARKKHAYKLSCQQTLVWQCACV